MTYEDRPKIVGAWWQKLHVLTAKLRDYWTEVDQIWKEVQIHHLHIKSFHMVKRLRKSVQYIQRYSTKYVEPREHLSLIHI